MFVDQASKVIFFHVPKTGGRSIKKTFGFVESERDKRLSHFLPETAREVLFQETWHQYWKFCFVRNPWERFVSLYEFHRQSEHSKKFTPEHHKFAMMSNFSEWFYANTTGGITRTDWFGSPQHQWWEHCDRIFQYENIKQSYSEISTYIRPVMPLQHENATEHKPYQSYYKYKYHIEMVKELEGRTIEMFGYTFE
jgi:chondroitin 4-sulfotransferase 11